MKINRLVLFLSLFLCSFFNSLADNYSGVVFNDLNGNRVKENNEKGIANIKVSNGLHITTTNSRGEFFLPYWNKARFISIYKPSGYSCSEWFKPVNETNVAFNFALTQNSPSERNQFVQISDTETFEHRDWLNNLKDYIKNQQPNFVVHTGDICYHSGMEWHSKNVTEKQLGVPIYYCLGNHDMVKGDYGEQFFESQFGPAWYAFEYGKVLYVDRKSVV